MCDFSVGAHMGAPLQIELKQEIQRYSQRHACQCDRAHQTQQGKTEGIIRTQTKFLLAHVFLPLKQPLILTQNYPKKPTSSSIFAFFKK